MSDGWIVYRGNAGQLHVIPANDAIPHEAHGGCWCQPINDPVEWRLWIHRSADNREAHEPDAVYPSATRH